MQEFFGGSDAKESLQCGRLKFYPWVGKILQRREWVPTVVFLSGEFPGQRSLEGYSPGDHREFSTTEQLTLKHFQNVLCPNLNSVFCPLLTMEREGMNFSLLKQLAGRDIYNFFFFFFLFFFRVSYKTATCIGSHAVRNDRE